MEISNNTNQEQSNTEVKDKLNKAIGIAAYLFKQATGFDEYQRKKLAYYAVATHYIKDFDPFPQLAIYGAPGTGKSATMNILRGLCGKVVSITGETTSEAALKAAMKAAECGTLIIEEADQATQRELENTLVTRYSRASASNSKMVHDGNEWVFDQSGTFGASIFHRRNLFRDAALLRRVIAVQTKRKRGDYTSVTMDSHGSLFQEFHRQLDFQPSWPAISNKLDIEAAILDCYKPIIALTKLTEDAPFLESLAQEIYGASNRLLDEESYLDPQVLLKALITLTSQKIKGKVTGSRINIEVSKIDPTVKDEFGASCPVLKLSANQRNRILREDLGFLIKSSHGRHRLYLNLQQLIETCEANAVEDDCFQEWKVALGMAEGEAPAGNLELSEAWETEEE